MKIEQRFYASKNTTEYYIDRSIEHINHLLRSRNTLNVKAHILNAKKFTLLNLHFQTVISIVLFTIIFIYIPLQVTFTLGNIEFTNERLVNPIYFLYILSGILLLFYSPDILDNLGNCIPYCGIKEDLLDRFNDLIREIEKTGYNGKDQIYKHLKRVPNGLSIHNKKEIFHKRKEITDRIPPKIEKEIRNFIRMLPRKDKYCINNLKVFKLCYFLFNYVDDIKDQKEIILRIGMILYKCDIISISKRKATQKDYQNLFEKLFGLKESKSAHAIFGNVLYSNERSSEQKARMDLNDIKEIFEEVHFKRLVDVIDLYVKKENKNTRYMSFRLALLKQ